MGFVAKLLQFFSRAQPTCLPQASLSKMYSLLLFCRISTGEKMSFSSGAYGPFGSALIKGPSYLPFELRGPFESVDTVLVKLDRNHLSTLQSPRNDLSLVAVIVTCILRTASAMCFATLRFRDLIVRCR